MSDILINYMARTIYGEARGEYNYLNGGLPALIAIGNVIINRLNLPHEYGSSIEEVCLKPEQFSCWNKNDPNYIIINQETISDPIFDICNHVSVSLMSNLWPDVTKGSDHYHVFSEIPYWAKGHEPKIRIGRHIFYQLTPPKI